MNENASATSSRESHPTQHAMLIVWGHFARTLRLVEQLAQVAIAQRTVVRAPQEKGVELLIGLLSGIEYQADLSAGAAPLSEDGEVAAAWRLRALADASGVSRTLAACDDESVAQLEAILDRISQPFVDRAVRDLRQRGEPLVLDGDLTGRAVSSTSRTFPGAAFGYMDGEVRLGYQLAEVCVQTRVYGRQWLAAAHHPGDTVSVNCLLELVLAAERRLGCHPRRRTELLQQRLTAYEQTMARLEHHLQTPDPRLVEQVGRIEHLTAAIEAVQARIRDLLAAPASDRQGGPYSWLTRLRKQVQGWEGQRQRAQQRLADLRAVVERQQERSRQELADYQAQRQQLLGRYQQFCQDNAQQSDPPRCRFRLDAGFCSGPNLIELIERGYEVDTKSANAALLQALRDRVCADTVWTAVGKNAEMVAWTGYQLHTCPYPLTVALERFHTPPGMRHAVLIRYPDAPQAADIRLEPWFHEYNARQSVEAGNKEEKTTFKVQHLMSRSPAGIRMQALLTVFAANFVRWADAWIRPRVEHSTTRFQAALTSPKRLVRVAANSPAVVERLAGRELVRFSPLSSFSGVVIRLSGLPGYQLDLPLFAANDHFSSA